MEDVELVNIENENLTGSRLAPIALFVYRRPDHTRRTIASLQNCKGFENSRLFVFADGPKTEADADAVRTTRLIVHNMLGTRAAYVERDRNIGLANSIIDGVTRLCNEFGSVIVVEDDLILAPSFLQFLNEGLQRYEHHPQVMQISGHIVDTPCLIHEDEALFLPFTTSWGWATWKRAWEFFDQSATGWDAFLKDADKRTRFDLSGRYPFSRMLERQMNGKRDSWAIRFYYTVFNQHGLVLFPPRSLVLNAGMDGTGTHSRVKRATQTREIATLEEMCFPDDVRVSKFELGVFDAIGASLKVGRVGGLGMIRSIAVSVLGKWRQL